MSDQPKFLARHLLILGTGSVGVTFLPYWLNWLRVSYPQIESRVVVTRSAERFVTRHALAAVLGQDVALDAWPDEPDSPHVEYAMWPDTVLVYPATYHFVSRLAQGLGDTPALLALQCTKALIGVVPALPPGGLDSPAYLRNLELLRVRPNVVVVDPVPGLSAHTRRHDGLAAAPLPDVIRRLEKHR